MKVRIQVARMMIKTLLVGLDLEQARLLKMHKLTEKREQEPAVNLARTDRVSQMKATVGLGWQALFKTQACTKIRRFLFPLMSFVTTSYSKEVCPK